MKKEIKENWEEIILKSCIEAEKMYQLESDKTPESWFAIYKANVIEKIRQLLKSEKEKARQEIIKEILSKMEIEINGRDITIYELGDWLIKLKSQLKDKK